MELVVFGCTDGLNLVNGERNSISSPRKRIAGSAVLESEQFLRGNSRHSSVLGSRHCRLELLVLVECWGPMACLGPI